MNVYKTLKLLNLNSFKGTLNCKLREHINHDNVCFYHEFVHNFCDQTIQSYALNYVERWFCLIVENNKHLDLSFSVFKNLCLSGNLNITSELEVFNATDDWIKYDPEERNKFAFQLIKTIRLPLLSAAALKNLLNSDTFFLNCEESKNYIKLHLKNKKPKSIILNSTECYNRYCSQESFDLIVSGGYYSELLNQHRFWYRRVSNDVYKLNGYNFANSSKLTTLDNPISEVNAVFCNGIIYFLDTYFICSYSILTEKWIIPKNYPKSRSYFSACALISKVYILGGRGSKKTSVAFNPKNNNFERIANMKEMRVYSACAIFEGKIVVSGGTMQGGYLNSRKSVEVYDPSSNRWSMMPDMLEGRQSHSSVSIRNKIYMIGGHSRNVEVFDRSSNKFVQINISLPQFKQSVLIGKTVYMFNDDADSFFLFDVDKTELSEVKEVTSLNSLCHYCCVKIPQY